MITNSFLQWSLLYKVPTKMPMYNTVKENRIHKLSMKYPHGLICAWLAVYRRTIDTYRQHTIELEFSAPVGRTKPTDPALPPFDDHKLPSSPTFACHFTYLTRRRPQSQNRL